MPQALWPFFASSSYKLDVASVVLLGSAGVDACAWGVPMCEWTAIVAIDGGCTCIRTVAVSGAGIGNDIARVGLRDVVDSTVLCCCMGGCNTVLCTVSDNTLMCDSNVLTHEVSLAVVL